VGARFYTYTSTMGLAMEAAAEAGKEFIVLDRPNPISGAIMEGPLLDEGGRGKGEGGRAGTHPDASTFRLPPSPFSFVAFHSIPIRHGMTSGELARMFAKERGLVQERVGEGEKGRGGVTNQSSVSPSPRLPVSPSPRFRLTVIP